MAKETWLGISQKRKSKCQKINFTNYFICNKGNTYKYSIELSFYTNQNGPKMLQWIIQADNKPKEE